MQTKLPPPVTRLLHSKQGRLKLAIGTVVLIVVLFWLFSGSSAPPPVMASAQPAPAIVKPAPPAPPNTGNSQIILDLFSPSDASLSQQQRETTYAQQIEQTMAVTFLLTKCAAISQDDYSTIFRALILYAQRVHLAEDAANAEARVREIAEASKASYALVYSRVTCSDPQLAPLARQTSAWAEATLKLP